jgi:hypothetical protein
MTNGKFRLGIQALVSLGLLAAGLWTLTDINWAENPEMAAAATGWVGLVIGYWLK